MAMDAMEGERFGSRAVILVARLGLLFCAGMALWRLGLYLYSEFGGVALEVPVASLTFMPIPDALFAVVFLGLASLCGRAITTRFIEAGVIAAGLHIVTLVSYFVVFYGWTKGAAFGLGQATTYLHIAVPVLFCLWFAGRLAWIAWRRWRLERVLAAGAGR